MTKLLSGSRKSGRKSKVIHSSEYGEVDERTLATEVDYCKVGSPKEPDYSTNFSKNSQKPSDHTYPHFSGGTFSGKY